MPTIGRSGARIHAPLDESLVAGEPGLALGRTPPEARDNFKQTALTEQLAIAARLRDTVGVEHEVVLEGEQELARGIRDAASDFARGHLSDDLQVVVLRRA
jgi:hypothetical protein